MLTISTLFESITDQRKKSNINQDASSKLLLPAAAVAGTAGLVGFGAHKWYENEQRRNWERYGPEIKRLEKMAERIRNMPPKDDIFDTDDAIKNTLFTNRHGSNISRALSNSIKPVEPVEPANSTFIVSKNPENNDVDSDDKDINDLVADAHNI